MADLGHQPAEARLDHRDLIDRHVLLPVGPEDPRVHASPELGERTCKAIVERMVAFVDKLSEFDADPVHHGPTHTQMGQALRAMAAAYEDTSGPPCRRDETFHQAAALFYAGEFGQAVAALR